MRNMFVALLILVVATSFAVVATDTTPSFRTFYWIKEGAFFVYRVRVVNVSNGIDVGYANMWITDMLTNVSCLTHSGDVEILWKILRVEGNYIYVEYVLRIERCVVDNHVVTNLSFVQHYLVDMRTLNVYLRNGSELEWVGEWPFLIHPYIAIHGGPKLISFSSAETVLVLSKQRYEHLYEQLLKLGITECIEPVSSTEGISVKNASDYVIARTKNGSVHFVSIGLLPGVKKYCVPRTNVCISEDRIVGFTYNSTTYNEMDLEDLVKLYNDSSRHLKVFFVDAYGGAKFVLLMHDDECYLADFIGPDDISVLYDSVTGILLKETVSDPLILLSLKDLVRRFDICVEPLPQLRKGIAVVLELVSTNIHLGRPVIGGANDVKVPLVVAISVAIPSLSLLYVALRRRHA